jgi:hypothetical protein
MYYESIKNRTSNSDVVAIAKNTGFNYLDKDKDAVTPLSVAIMNEIRRRVK